ncbi:DUF4175 family protein [Robertkochia solimangrovi]|uniref:DUF4175 family protein n=1 Tax=Robertkochia solimangrovi TaxID=2213046 RepID=UPI0011810112|nr:DUF4175 family protein [Robertkochia solimangrovi]TRZ46058.1 hypothetical protein DMZ48_01955 [Robertkochia solimangrovi]
MSTLKTDHISIINSKLELFLRKYYTNDLVKGIILFIVIGLVYLLFSIAVEWLFWMDPMWRTLWFWLFVMVEILLFTRFIVFPLLYIFKLKKGLDHQEASKIIGKHFPEVQDKLLNLLQLKEQDKNSELVLASIAQRSEQLKPIPFQSAITFKSNIKYLKYLIIPSTILLLILLSGSLTGFSMGYSRMIHHNIAYTPPAPFEFLLINDSLTVLENSGIIIKTQTKGKLIPENIQIEYGGEKYFMNNLGEGRFEYDFENIKENIPFKLSANDVYSIPYEIEVIEVPRMLNLSMELDYPTYTGKKKEILNGTGNAQVPEGTKIKWIIDSRNTKNIKLSSKDTILVFQKETDQFKLYHSVYNNFNYNISSANEEVSNYDKLEFRIDVTKDKSPDISVISKKDSTYNQEDIFVGEISDDYGISKLELVYYPSGSSDNSNKIKIPIKKGNYDRFIRTFPGTIALPPAVPYEFYFEVTDNDGLRGGKSTRSSIFTYRRLSKSEKQDLQLQEQQQTIDKIDHSLEKFEEHQKELNTINDQNKEKQDLNYTDRKNIENYLERQQQQEQMMQKFNQDLKKNLDEFNKENPEQREFNELLKERLEREALKLKQNEELLKELEKYSDKINKDELSKKLEELSKQQQNDKRSLKQLLELTKRYYVSAKADKIKKDLKDLAKEQEDLSQSTNNNSQQQDSLNTKFDTLSKEMEQLQKENDQLRKPMELGMEKKNAEEIKQDQQKAQEELQKFEENNKNEAKQNAQKNQKNAAQKMRKMSQKMDQSMSMSGAQMLMEDTAMLRQILDNLVIYSFEQESIMEKLNDFNQKNPNFPKYLKKQNDLKSMFEHIDDSLFALSLRKPELTEQINTNITEVFYNLDKTLDNFANNNISQGIANQQYALTASNELADFLSEVLDNLQQSMSGSSGGGSQDFQLPDIIQSQQELNEKMQQGSKQNKEGEPQQQNGEEQGEGEGKQETKSGQGQNGQEQMSQELFEVYKQQQQLRNALEEQLQNMQGEGNKQKADVLIKEMERIENSLLERGFNENTLKRMQQLTHELLKLKNAAQEQGQDKERESKTNTKNYTNTSTDQSPELQEYLKEIEILNRQILPLRQNYKERVQEYFKKND